MEIIKKNIIGNLRCKNKCQKQPPEVFYKKGVLRNFTKFTGKHLCQSLSFNKVADLRPATLLKKRLWHRCFPVNFVKFLRTPFLQNTAGRLLLKCKCLSVTRFFYNQHFYKQRQVKMDKKSSKS